MPCTWRHQLRLYWNVSAGTGHPPILAAGRGREGRHVQTRLATASHLEQNFPLAFQTTAPCFPGLQHPAFSAPSCPLCSRAPSCSVQCHSTWQRDCLSLLFSVPAGKEGLIVSVMGVTLHPAELLGMYTALVDTMG